VQLTTLLFIGGFLADTTEQRLWDTLGAPLTAAQASALELVLEVPDEGTNLGSERPRRDEGTEDQLGALGLVLNCITLWNTIYLDAATLMQASAASCLVVRSSTAAAVTLSLSERRDSGT
jgi:hypothetical protein